MNHNLVKLVFKPVVRISHRQPCDKMLYFPAPALNNEDYIKIRIK